LSNPLATAGALQLGESVRHRGVVVTPLFSRVAPRADYVCLAHGRWLGTTVRELATADGRVRNLVLNLAPSAVLVHEDELLTATPERSVLVPAGSILELGAGGAPPPLRGPAWDVAGTDDLDDLLARFPLQPGQCGAVFSVGGRPVRLDLHSRPEAFHMRYPVLLRRVVMEAHRQPMWVPTPEAVVSCFADAVLWAPMTTGPTPGLGERLVVDGGDLTGTGLVVDGEVVHLTVTEATGAPPPGAG
jgi:hypothetical protein